MDAARAVPVGVQQRADEQHGRAGRSHDGRDSTADGQEEGVVAGGGADVAVEEDAAGDHEESQQQHDELDVLDERVADLGAVAGQDEPCRDRKAAGEGDEQFDAVAFPGVGGGGDQWQQGDAQQQDDERDDAPPFHLHVRPSPRGRLPPPSSQVWMRTRGSVPP